MKRVIIETPYAAPSDGSRSIELHLRYLRACLHDAIMNHGEAPFASHGLYTQPGVLRDEIREERDAGIHASFAWRDVAEATIVYTDLGISRGMQYGIDHAQKVGCHVEYRTLGWPWNDVAPVEFKMISVVDYATSEWGKS